MPKIFRFRNSTNLPRYKQVLKKVLLKLGVNRFIKKQVFEDEWQPALKRLFSRSEQRRLRNKKRYETGETILLGKPLFYSDNVALVGMLHEIFIKDNYRFESSSDRPCIVDCGANIGLSLLYFKTIYPDCDIDAVEPDPLVFDLLQKNIQSFGFRDIHLHNKAVWINDSTLTFQSDRSWGGYVGQGRQSVYTEPYQVSGIDLNDLLTRKIDMLKMDIEGAETEVLLHAKENVVKNVDKLFFEWHSVNGNNQELGEILTYFGNNGFRYHIKEASVRKSPFVNRRTNVRMDSQLDCFLYKV